MSHANAALTPRARLRLARLVVDDGWTRAAAAKMFMVVAETAGSGPLGTAPKASAGMADRSSRPRRSPTKTSPDWCAGSCGCGGDTGSARSRSPAASACRPPPSTRCWCGAGSTGSPTSTGSPVNRCAATSTPTRVADPCRCHQVRQHPRRRRTPLRRPPARRRSTSAQHPVCPEARTTSRAPGKAFLHTVIDDHSRVAYVEICADEKADTAVGVLRRAVAWFADRGVTRRTGALRQRQLLPLARLARHLRRTRHHPQTHPPLPATDQRQNRTLPPHPGRRLGLCPVLQLRNRTPSSPAGLAPLLQSPPSPLRHRRQAPISRLTTSLDITSRALAAGDPDRARTDLAHPVSLCQDSPVAPAGLPGRGH